MLIRKCAGGVVFHQGRVLLEYNEKNEWVFPKARITDPSNPAQAACAGVKQDLQVEAEVLAEIGSTEYEFYSVRRQRRVRNQVRWFCMLAKQTELYPNADNDIFEAGFYSLQEALTLLSHSKSRAILIKAYQHLQQCGMAE